MTPSRDEIVDLVVRWEEARANGQDISPEELCRDRPELLDEVRRTIERLGHVEWLNRPVGSTTTATANPGDAGAAALPVIMAERYRLDVLIGEGGFGRVYRGFDLWLERFVALKVPRIDRPISSSEVDLCRTEARKVARLRHPNIVPVHDVGRDGATCFIVSDWIDGSNMASLIAARQLSHRESALIVAQVADALDHAHAAGFVHRDIKPANILVDQAGQAYLTDFGVAAVEEDLVGEVKHVGTLPYMAPEQLDETFGAVDHRTDLYALGVVLYESLTARRPFRADSPAELRQRILDQGPFPPSAFDDSIPAELERISLRCMAKSPGDRYQTADAVAADVRCFLAP